MKIQVILTVLVCVVMFSCLALGLAGIILWHLCGKKALKKQDKRTKKADRQKTNKEEDKEEETS